MKKLGLILVLMILSLQGWAQGSVPYFNILDDFFGKGFGDWGADVLPLSDSTYVIAGTAQDSVTGSGLGYVFSRPYFMRLSADGTILSRKNYCTPYQQFGGINHGMFLATNDGGFAVAGVWQRWNQDFTGSYYGRYVLKLNSTLDSIWMALDSGSQVLNRFLSVKKILITSDNGYLLAGETYNGRLNFTKFHESGVLLWNRTTSYSSGLLNLKPTTDGGYFLTGWKNSYAYLCKLDSACDVVWERTYDPIPGVQNSAYGIPLADGGFVFAYGLRDIGGTIDLHFSWMDTSLVIYHEETLFMEFDQFPIEMIELEDHSLIVSGRSGDRAGGDNSDRAFMLKFSPQRDILWLRKYFWWHGGSNVNSDCALAHDGGFILTGSSWDTTGTSPFQDTWILKVDSVGCPFPDCGPSLVFAPTATVAQDLVVASPNPASEHLRLQTVGEGLHTQAVIRLLALDGRVMEELILPMGFRELMFDVSRYPAGMYLWEYKDAAGRREAARFEVMR